MAEVKQPGPLPGIAVLQQVLDELRREFPGRCIWQSTREHGGAGALYASTGGFFTEKELQAGYVKTVFADIPDELRALLNAQPAIAEVAET